MMRLFIEMPECVDKPAFHEVTDPLPLFGREPGRIGITYRVVNVDRLMADVVIARNDQAGDFFLQSAYVLLKVVQEPVFEILALVTRGARRSVHAHYRKVLKVGT